MKNPLLPRFSPILLLLVVCGCAAQMDAIQSGSADSGENLDSGLRAEIPIEFVKEMAIVEATVEGIDRPLRLLLDTGAPTAIRSSVAATIEKRRDDSLPEEMTGTDAFGGALQFRPILIKKITLGDISFRDVPAVEFESSVFDAFCPPIDGLLGSNGQSGSLGLLDRAMVEVDRDERTMRISRSLHDYSREGVVVPAQRYLLTDLGSKLDLTELYIPVTLEDQRFWAVLDTGASGLSTITLATFKDLGRSTDDDDVRVYRGSHSLGAAGRSSSKGSWLASLDLEIGGIKLPAVPFRVEEGSGSLGEAVGIHQDVLRYFNFRLDERRGELRLNGRRSQLQTPGLETQLSWEALENRLVVAGILEDGVAERAGVQIGDELVSINGARVILSEQEGLCVPSFRENWSEGKGPRKLVLKRDGREFEVSLPRSEPKGNPE